jgi:hypothetical protein
MSSQYRIQDRIIDSDDRALADALANIYRSKERPLCLCRAPGIEMYVAKVAGKYILKRMPNSGGGHAHTCESYEPPAELSGLGDVIGTAIRENPDEGTTSLKLDFSLTKGAGRAAPIPSGNDSDSVKTNGTKLSLRGTFHYLWDQAQFSRWTPGMASKRNWYVIRKYLLQAVGGKMTKGGDLADVLYIPETFDHEKKDEIAQRRMALTSSISAPQNGARRLMLVIGEVKEIAQSRYGHKIVLKHLPDYHFTMADDLYKRLLKRFDVELGLRAALDNSHLMMIGTFGVGVSGVATLEEVALIIVSENWIPFENTSEKIVLDALTSNNRVFVKGLRYNMQSSRPIACAVVSDTEPLPTALYVVPPGASEEYIKAVNCLIEDSKLNFWLWSAGAAPMPPLPERAPDRGNVPSIAGGHATSVQPLLAPTNHDQDTR